MNTSFWYGKKVFLTGHTGFKGSWLSLWLQSMGANLTGYALNPPTKINLYDIANVDAGMCSINANVCDLDALLNAMSEAKPEIVIHMAAQSLVRFSYQSPVETYATNVMGTVNVLEAVRQADTVRVVVIVTSDKCYQNQESLLAYLENDPMGGADPYSSSKGCAELITTAYRNSYFSPAKYQEHGVAVASVRAGNVIGGGDWAEDRLIPDIMCAIIKNKPVKIRNPQSIRPWQHVLEPLHGYLHLAQILYENGGLYSEGWNFGPHAEDAKPVKWIVDRLFQLWGDGFKWELDKEPNHPHEAQYLKLDCSKARVQLNWFPYWHLEEGLDATVTWYKAYQANNDMLEVTLRQISQYESNFVPNDINNFGVGL